MWSDIISHAKQIEQLVCALRSGRLASAYLFTGPKGVGKHMVAKAFASALVCEMSAKHGFDACGICTGCLKVRSRSHPDVFFIEPESERPEKQNNEAEKKKAPSENIKIEQIRELKAGLNFHPLEAKAKIAIVDHADRMTEATANSMLKVLEEPPPATHFVLISTTPHRLLATIRSRCMELKFQPISNSDIAEELVKDGRMSAEEANRIAGLSSGSLGSALLMDPDLISGVIGRFCALVKKASSADIIEAAEDWSHGDLRRVRFILDVITSWYRDVVFFLAKGDPSVLIHPGVKTWANEIGMSNATNAILKISLMRRSLETTINKQLMFEDLLFTLTR